MMNRAQIAAKEAKAAKAAKVSASWSAFADAIAEVEIASRMAADAYDRAAGLPYDERWWSEADVARQRAETARAALMALSIKSM